MIPWNAPKAKVRPPPPCDLADSPPGPAPVGHNGSCFPTYPPFFRLSVQRLRTLQQKKEAQAKASRRDIATLLERGKIETARIKVESREPSQSHIHSLLCLTDVSD